MHRLSITVTAFIVLIGTGCTRKTIEFGDAPENNYTRLAFIDTVGIKLSTVMIDSFSTSTPNNFLLGRYKDPYLGVTTTAPFFQLDKPAEIPGIPTTAFYDSIVFIMRLDNYYYGDTTRPQTIYVNELAQSIVTRYNNRLYNTSNFPVKATPLASRTLTIRPVADDSISIRLSNVLGEALFDKMRQRHTDILTTDNFLNYFKGISLTTDANDTTAIYGLISDAASIVMRLHYHTTIPNQQRQFIDFPSLKNAVAFNQVLANRSGTGIVPGITGMTEIPASQTGNRSFSQPGTGLRLKIAFPSLKGIMLTQNYVKLLRAELIVRPAFQSYDRTKYPLPPSLALAYTDNTNIASGYLTDSTGGVMYASPVIDDIYGQNTYYRFNISSYINSLLQTAASEKYGLFIMDKMEESQLRMHRLVSATTDHSNYITQLQVSVLIVNK
jgi:hypothetical protein